MAHLSVVLGRLYDEYSKRTPKKLKIIDAYLLYVFLTGVIQFVYCCLVGTFPFNSFLSGFISCISCFVLGVCLRLQVNPQNKNDFVGISAERGFADFIFAHVILHLVVMNFIGISLTVKAPSLVRYDQNMYGIISVGRLFIEEELLNASRESKF